MMAMVMVERAPAVRRTDMVARAKRRARRMAALWAMTAIVIATLACMVAAA